jgi:hypothetical protein
VAKADTGGQQTCRGHLTADCVNDQNCGAADAANIAKLPGLLKKPEFDK